MVSRRSEYHRGRQGEIRDERERQREIQGKRNGFLEFGYRTGEEGKLIKRQTNIENEGNKRKQ